MIGPDEITAFLGTLAPTMRCARRSRQQPERVKLTPVNLDTEELSAGLGAVQPDCVRAVDGVGGDGALLFDGTSSPRRTARRDVAPRRCSGNRAAACASVRRDQPASPCRLDQTLMLEGSGLFGERSGRGDRPGAASARPANLRDDRLLVAHEPACLVCGLTCTDQSDRASIAIPGATGGGAGRRVSNALAVMVRPVSAPSRPREPGHDRFVSMAVTPLPAADQNVEAAARRRCGAAQRPLLQTAGSDVVFTLPSCPAGTWRIHRGRGRREQPVRR